MTTEKPTVALIEGTQARVSCMGFEAYRKVQAINKSLLDHIAPPNTPAHCKHRMTEPESETPALRLGHLTHSAILEPESAKTWAIAPEGLDFRTKEGRAWKEANTEKEIVPWTEHQRISAMRDAVWRHPAAGQLLLGARVERSIFAWDEPTGLPVKARVDAIAPVALVDLKTTESAAPRAFAKDMARFRYHVQGAFYLDLYAAIHPETVQAEAFLIIAVEKSPPYAVAVYLIERAAIDKGRAEYRRDLDLFAQCYRADCWPAYSDQIEPLTLPDWYE